MDLCSDNITKAGLHLKNRPQIERDFAQTKKYLLLGHHLDTANAYSPIDEFGFIAIEYCLAIENEFKTQIVEGYLSLGGSLVYRVVIN